jgi:hypothetical protein
VLVGLEPAPANYVKRHGDVRQDPPALRMEVDVVWGQLAGNEAGARQGFDGQGEPGEQPRRVAGRQRALCQQLREARLTARVEKRNGRSSLVPPRLGADEVRMAGCATPFHRAGRVASRASFLDPAHAYLQRPCGTRAFVQSSDSYRFRAKVPR